MNEDAVSQIKKEIAEAIKGSMGAFLGEEVDRTKAALGIPIGRDKGRIIRSDPGEDPRKEKGNLQRSIQSRVIEEGNLIVGILFTDDPKAEWLNDGTARIEPRPFWDHAWDRVQQNGDKLESDIAESISGNNTPAYSGTA